jgi:hypothetical protein
MDSQPVRNENLGRITVSESAFRGNRVSVQVARNELKRRESQLINDICATATTTPKTYCLRNDQTSCLSVARGMNYHLPFGSGKFGASVRINLPSTNMCMRFKRMTMSGFIGPWNKFDNIGNIIYKLEDKEQNSKSYRNILRQMFGKPTFAEEGPVQNVTKEFKGDDPTHWNVEPPYINCPCFGPPMTFHFDKQSAEVYSCILHTKTASDSLYMKPVQIWAGKLLPTTLLGEKDSNMDLAFGIVFRVNMNETVKSNNPVYNEAPEPGEEDIDPYFDLKPDAIDELMEVRPDLFDDEMVRTGVPKPKTPETHKLPRWVNIIEIILVPTQIQSVYFDWGLPFMHQFKDVNIIERDSGYKLEVDRKKDNFDNKNNPLSLIKDLMKITNANKNEFKANVLPMLPTFFKRRFTRAASNIHLLDTFEAYSNMAGAFMVNQLQIQYLTQIFKNFVYMIVLHYILEGQNGNAKVPAAVSPDMVWHKFHYLCHYTEEPDIVPVVVDEEDPDHGIPEEVDFRIQKDLHDIFSDGMQNLSKMIYSQVKIFPYGMGMAKYSTSSQDYENLKLLIQYFMYLYPYHLGQAKVECKPEHTLDAIRIILDAVEKGMEWQEATKSNQYTTVKTMIEQMRHSMRPGAVNINEVWTQEYIEPCMITRVKLPVEMDTLRCFVDLSDLFKNHQQLFGLYKQTFPYQRAYFPKKTQLGTQINIDFIPMHVRLLNRKLQLKNNNNRTMNPEDVNRTNSCFAMLQVDFDNRCVQWTTMRQHPKPPMLVNPSDMTDRRLLQSARTHQRRTPAQPMQMTIQTDAEFVWSPEAMRKAKEEEAKAIVEAAENRRKVEIAKAKMLAEKAKKEPGDITMEDSVSVQPDQDGAAAMQTDQGGAASVQADQGGAASTQIRAPAATSVVRPTDIYPDEPQDKESINKGIGFGNAHDKREVYKYSPQHATYNAENQSPARTAAEKSADAWSRESTPLRKSVVRRNHAGFEYLVAVDDVNKTSFKRAVEIFAEKYNIVKSEGEHQVLKVLDSIGNSSRVKLDIGHLRNKEWDHTEVYALIEYDETHSQSKIFITKLLKPHDQHPLEAPLWEIPASTQCSALWYVEKLVNSMEDDAKNKFIRYNTSDLRRIPANHEPFSPVIQEEGYGDWGTGSIDKSDDVKEESMEQEPTTPTSPTAHGMGTADETKQREELLEFYKGVHDKFYDSGTKEMKTSVKLLNVRAVTFSDQGVAVESKIWMVNLYIKKTATGVDIFLAPQNKAEVKTTLSSIDKKEIFNKATEILKQYGLELWPDSRFQNVVFDTIEASARQSPYSVKKGPYSAEDPTTTLTITLSPSKHIKVYRYKNSGNYVIEPNFTTPRRLQLFFTDEEVRNVLYEYFQYVFGHITSNIKRISELAKEILETDGFLQKTKAKIIKKDNFYLNIPFLRTNIGFHYDIDEFIFYKQVENNPEENYIEKVKLEWTEPNVDAVIQHAIQVLKTHVDNYVESKWSGVSMARLFEEIKAKVKDIHDLTYQIGHGDSKGHQVPMIKIEYNTHKYLIVRPYGSLKLECRDTNAKDKTTVHPYLLSSNITRSITNGSDFVVSVIGLGGTKESGNKRRGTDPDTTDGAEALPSTTTLPSPKRSPRGEGGAEGSFTGADDASDARSVLSTASIEGEQDLNGFTIDPEDPGAAAFSPTGLQSEFLSIEDVLSRLRLSI